MKIAYIDKRFRSDALSTIAKANEILEEYEDQNLTLTLRQLYYQFVARGLLDNNQLNYKRLADTINNARLAGKVSWTAIEDRTRNLKAPPFWSNPADIIQSAHYSYRENIWDQQPTYVEVWVEKDALLGVVQQACDPLRVPYFSCRGYTSQSEVWGAAQRFQQMDKPCLLIHLGDHDPSGCDMSRDITERLQETFGVSNVTVDRIALNMDQIRRYNPPPNPAKLSDSRSDGYIAEHGDESWELDALEPKTLNELITDRIYQEIDDDAWEEAKQAENERKDELALLANNYEKAIKFLRRK